MPTGHLSRNTEADPSPRIHRAFKPNDYFEISIGPKAENLGELDSDPAGVGEGLGFNPAADYADPRLGALINQIYKVFLDYPSL